MKKVKLVLIDMVNGKQLKFDKECSEKEAAINLRHNPYSEQKGFGWLTEEDFKNNYKLDNESTNNGSKKNVPGAKPRARTKPAEPNLKGGGELQDNTGSGMEED